MGGPAPCRPPSVSSRDDEIRVSNLIVRIILEAISERCPVRVGEGANRILRMMPDFELSELEVGGLITLVALEERVPIEIEPPFGVRNESPNGKLDDGETRAQHVFGVPVRHGETEH